MIWFSKTTDIAYCCFMNYSYFMINKSL